jgi:hypothetical protein
MDAELEDEHDNEEGRHFGIATALLTCMLWRSRNYFSVGLRKRV